ncbi:MAG: hemerythrin domain-containing protein [Burkholderiaceae bacterium]
MDACLPGAAPPSKSGGELDAPLAQLSTCHGRLDARCARLLRLVEAGSPQTADAAAVAPAIGPTAAAAAAEAADLIRFFDHVLAQHHADEEEDLFPALIESMAGSDAVCLKDMTEALRSEHRMLEADWRRLRAELEQVERGATGTPSVLNASSTPSTPSTELASAAQRFAERLRSHGEREDGELLPMAERLLSDDELAVIAASMQRRRSGGAARTPRE